MAHAKHAKPVIFPQGRESGQEAKQENPFDPYKMFSQPHAQPFFMSHKLLHTWFEMNQKFWQNYLEYAMWRNKALLEMMFESTRWAMHSTQLMGNPQAYQRYLRANWQKPFMSVNAQALNSARTWTHLMMDNSAYFQRMMGDIAKESQKHTQH